MVCGFLSRQLGEQQQPNNSAVDEMDEIEAAEQADLKRVRAGQGRGVRSKP